MKSRWPVAVAVLLAVLMATSVFAADLKKLTKQNGGSTGDSVTAAADTSQVVRLARSNTRFQVIAANDSSTIYIVQVSPDSSNWFTVDTDTVAAGTAETTVDWGGAYNLMWIRVIQDMIPSGGADYGNTFVVVD